MMRLQRTVLIMLPAVAATSAASTPGAEPMTLKVGNTVEFNPGFLPAQVVCDDLGVVRVDDLGKAFGLTGLRRARCLIATSIARIVFMMARDRLEQGTDRETDADPAAGSEPQNPQRQAAMRRRMQQRRDDGAEGADKPKPEEVAQISALL